MAEQSSAPPSDRVTLSIDGKRVSVAKGTLLVEAAREAGIEIPVFCYHSRLTPVGACRMCLVEIEKMPRLQTACTTPVAEGMVVSTQSKPATDAQEGVLELLLAHHPLDCPVCDKGGECPLQDNTFAHGHGKSRFTEAKRHKDKAFELGPRILLDKERCILCYRCVRFHQEVPGDEALAVIDRGGDSEIGTLDGHGYDSPFSGNTIDLCPVGALTSVDYRFRSRPWDLTRHRSVCSGCSMGCNTEIHARNGTILRLVPRENAAINDLWLCDRGRFDTKVGRQGRLGTPSLRAPRSGGSGDPGASSVSWSEGIAHVAKLLRGARVGIHVAGDVSSEALGVLTQGLLPQLPDARVSIAASCATAWPVQGDMQNLDRASAFVLVDFDAWNDLPVLALTLRRAIGRGAKLIVLGEPGGLSRDTHHAFPVAMNELAGTLDSLRSALSAASDDARMAAASAALQSGAVAVLASTASASDAPTRTALVAFVEALGAKAQVVLQGAPSLVANAAGAQRIAGSLIGGVDVFARAREGALDVLLTLGALPPTDLTCTTVAISWQPPTGADAALAAHVILPTCHPYEQAGSLVNFAGIVQAVEAGGMPPKGALPDHRALAELANALGASLPLELNDLRAELAKTESLFSPLIQPLGQPAAGTRRGLFLVHS